MPACQVIKQKKIDTGYKYCNGVLPDSASSALTTPPRPDNSGATQTPYDRIIVSIVKMLKTYIHSSSGCIMSHSARRSGYHHSRSKPITLDAASQAETTRKKDKINLDKIDNFRSKFQMTPQTLGNIMVISAKDVGIKNIMT